MGKRPHQNMWQQLISLSKESDEGLQLQLRRSLTQLILDDRISTETALPSSRELASMLEISRSTVTLAYQRLVDEGYLISKERQGYFANAELIKLASTDQRADLNSASERFDWESRLKYRVSRQRHIHKPADWYQYAYPFIFGQVDADLMPLSEWRECLRYAQGSRNFTRGGYDLLDQDDPSLVEQLRLRVLPQRGIWCHDENILVTLGAQNALALVAKLLIKTDSIIGIENPGYPDARNLFQLESSNVRLLDVDADGLVINDRLDECDYLYVTPSFQSPTTATLSPSRRTELLCKAADKNIVIIEDDYESEAAFGDEPIPSLKSVDANNCVIYCGSLSKSLAPGLRIGFIVADGTLISEARALRRLTVRHPPPLIEATVARFIELGHYDSHLNRLSKTYRQRWSVMTEALDEHFPDEDRRRTFGGTSFWIDTKGQLDTEQLAVSAGRKGVLIEPGTVHFGDNYPRRDCFRLGFSAINTEKIRPGVEILASIIGL